MELGSKVEKQSVQNYRCFEISGGTCRPEAHLKKEKKNNIIKVLPYSNETLCQILKAIGKEFSNI